MPSALYLRRLNVLKTNIILAENFEEFLFLKY